MTKASDEGGYVPMKDREPGWPSQLPGGYVSPPEPTDYEVRANHAAQGSSVHPFDGGQPRSPVAQRKLGPDLEDRAANRNAVIADQDAELRARQAGKPHSDSFTRSRRLFREDDLDDDGGWGDSAAAERYYYGYDPRP